MVGFLESARWTLHFPFVHDTALPAKPAGYWGVDYSFGVLTNIPLVWLALAETAGLADAGGGGRAMLRLFLAPVAVLFGMCALPLVFHDSMCLRYEVEYALPLVLLGAVGVLALERGLADWLVRRRDLPTRLSFCSPFRWRSTCWPLSKCTQNYLTYICGDALFGSGACGPSGRPVPKKPLT